MLFRRHCITVNVIVNVVNVILNVRRQLGFRHIVNVIVNVVNVIIIVVYANVYISFPFKLVFPEALYVNTSRCP